MFFSELNIGAVGRNCMSQMFWNQFWAFFKYSPTIFCTLRKALPEMLMFSLFSLCKDQQEMQVNSRTLTSRTGQCGNWQTNKGTYTENYFWTVFFYCLYLYEPYEKNLSFKYNEFKCWILMLHPFSPVFLACNRLFGLWSLTVDCWAETLLVDCLLA